MEARAKIAGHPIHAVLVVIPLGLLTASVGFDLARVFTGNTRWADISFWLIAVGVAGGVIAAVFGLLDWRAIPPGTRAKTVGLWHGSGNLLMLAFFALGWFLRHPDPLNPGPVPIVLSVLGILLAVVTGWLGGELVYRLGVGVHEGANPDAPSSLGRGAQESKVRVAESKERVPASIPGRGAGVTSREIHANAPGPSEVERRRPGAESANPPGEWP